MSKCRREDPYMTANRNLFASLTRNNTHVEVELKTNYFNPVVTFDIADLF